MNLYLLRHAIAVPSGSPGYPNDDRPLTEEGCKKMKKAARGINALRLEMELILTSPLARADATARIAAAALHSEDRVTTFEALLPETPLPKLISALSRYRRHKSLLLVGHEPNLSLLAAALLHAEGLAIQFKKGGLCCIEVTDIPPKMPGTLVWHLTPDQLRSLAKE